MGTVLMIALSVALAGVVVVLATGIVSMAIGGRFNKRWANRLMRMRVLLQGVAVALLAALMLLTVAPWSS